METTTHVAMHYPAAWTLRRIIRELRERQDMHLVSPSTAAHLGDIVDQLDREIDRAGREVGPAGVQTRAAIPAPLVNHVAELLGKASAPDNPLRLDPPLRSCAAQANAEFVQALEQFLGETTTLVVQVAPTHSAAANKRLTEVFALGAVSVNGRTCTTFRVEATAPPPEPPNQRLRVFIPKPAHC